ncbi:MAG: hypothetical protein PHI71_10435, partial [Acidiphilium sp.]|nr:hypothetical protein [Acidiphilium sp.]
NNTFVEFKKQNTSEANTASPGITRPPRNHARDFPPPAPRSSIPTPTPTPKIENPQTRRLQARPYRYDIATY